MLQMPNLGQTEELDKVCVGKIKQICRGNGEHVYNFIVWTQTLFVPEVVRVKRNNFVNKPSCPTSAKVMCSTLSEVFCVEISRLQLKVPLS